MASDRECCDKEAPHSTDSLVNGTSAKSKRNHAVLIQWLETHHDNPYPTKSEKHYLACYANMTQRQLNDWFANARRNIKKIGFAAWKSKHSPNLSGSRSRRTAVQAGGQAHAFVNAVDSKTTYHFPSLYPSSATGTNFSQNGSYLSTAPRNLIPLPIFNGAPTPTQFGTSTSNSAALYTLYPSHTGTQCSCSYCSSGPLPTAFPSHALGNLPVFSGFHSTMTSDVSKYGKGKKASPSPFIPLTHVSDIPQPQAYSLSSSASQTVNRNVIPTPSPQGLKEAQTPPDAESLNVCTCSPSSVRSPTPLQQQFSNTSPCPTLPTSSESAATGNGYEHEACKSTVAASMSVQELCPMNQIVYETRPETKPLFHLPNNNLPTSNISTSPTGPQWMWGGITSQTGYETELPEISETPSVGMKDGDFASEGLNQSQARLCLDQAHCP